jgi:polyhydroxybutyrate depolymerase
MEKDRVARMIRMALLAVAIGLAWPGALHACGADQPACAVPLGEYRVAEPRTASVPRPTIVFFHGAGGAGADILRWGELVDEFTAHGYVVIAPEGLVRRAPSTQGWYFRPNEPHARDELAFIRQVLDDATGRWHIDRARVLLAGESIGGSMVWYLACQAPREFAAFAPVAGGFWDPLPQGCAGPVKLLHTHGWRDETVPLEGRIIRNFAVQGDIFAGLGIWRKTNGCAAQNPAEIKVEASVWHRRWTGCAPGTWLEFVLHDGGHDVPDWWPRMARAWFERVVLR